MLLIQTQNIIIILKAFKTQHEIDIKLKSGKSILKLFLGTHLLKTFTFNSAFSLENNLMSKLQQIKTAN